MKYDKSILRIAAADPGLTDPFGFHSPVHSNSDEHAVSYRILERLGTQKLYSNEVTADIPHN